MSSLNKQAGGCHYRDCTIQPIEYIAANNLGYIEGNIIKYATRHQDKGGAEDIKKIIHYCEILLEMQYGENQQHDDGESRPDNTVSDSKTGTAEGTTRSFTIWRI